MPSSSSSSGVRAALSLACVLFAIGSILLFLVWVFFDFFVGMTVIDVYSWLPLVVLLGVVALLMTEKWTTTALTFPLVIVSLYGLYYLLVAIGSISFIPSSIKVPTVIIFLVLLNGSLFWFTRRAREQKQQNVH